MSESDNKARMNLEHWTAVDRYFSDNLVPSDSVLEAALAASVAAGLPAINVAPNQGKLLQLLVRIHGARTVLEIGTLGGYSTIWLARGLPAGGRITTLEIDPRHAEVARGNFVRAGLEKIIELRVGPAIETLPQLSAEGRGPFDFIFIDADKVSIHDYFQWALKLARSGSVIVVDNVVRNGAVIDAASNDANVLGVRRFVASLSRDSLVSATTLQTVGSKGYDGFTLAVMN
jgi:predicted O-methyltransferase YrrM